MKVFALLGGFLIGWGLLEINPWLWLIAVGAGFLGVAIMHRIGK